MIKNDRSDQLQSQWTLQVGSQQCEGRAIFFYVFQNEFWPQRQWSDFVWITQLHPPSSSAFAATVGHTLYNYPAVLAVVAVAATTPLTMPSLQDIVGRVWRGGFLRRLVWIMESRLGVRAGDAKTSSHYHNMCPPTPSPACVVCVPCLFLMFTTSFLSREEVGLVGRGTDAILIIGQGPKQWTGVPVCIEMVLALCTMPSATRDGGFWPLPLSQRGMWCPVVEEMRPPPPWKKTPTTTHCTALLRRPAGMNWALTSRAIRRVSSWLQMGNRPKPYSPKNTRLTVWAERLRRTWQGNTDAGQART